MWSRPIKKKKESPILATGLSIYFQNTIKLKRKLKVHATRSSNYGHGGGDSRRAVQGRY